MQPSDIKELAPILAGAIGAIATLLAVALTGFVSFKLAKLNLGEGNPPIFSGAQK